MQLVNPEKTDADLWAYRDSLSVYALCKEHTKLKKNKRKICFLLTGGLV